jgi:hypothetical protein
MRPCHPIGPVFLIVQLTTTAIYADALGEEEQSIPDVVR